MKNSIKDVPRGTANCDVLQESAEKDSTHVKRVTPMDTKAKQMKSAEELGINGQREMSTTRLRRAKDTRPL